MGYPDPLYSRPENDAASVAGSQQAPAGSVKSERNGAGATASGGGNNNSGNNSATNNGGGGEREGGVKRERAEGGQQPQGKRIKTERWLGFSDVGLKP